MSTQANDESKRKTVINDVIFLFIKAIDFLSDDEKKQVNEDTDIVTTFHVDTDDISIVIMDIENHFSINANHDEWAKISKIHEIADLVIKHLDKKST